MVQAILRRVRANVTLRLGNLQVASRFDDGEERFAHDWLRQNERDMASLPSIFKCAPENRDQPVSAGAIEPVKIPWRFEGSRRNR